MLKAIFFDFDGTLAEDGDAITDALSQACQVVCHRWPELRSTDLITTYRQISDTVWGDFDRYLRHLPSAEAMLAAVWHKTLARWGVHDPEVEQEAANTYWHHRLRTCKPYPDVLSLLHDLTGRFHLSVLTNGASVMQRDKLTATGLTPFFQQVFVGGEFGQGKPAPAIFRAALEAANCRPEQALHVGDSLVHDIAGARRLGIHSVWLNRRGLPSPSPTATGSDLTGLDCTPDFEISSLAHLPECLQQLRAE